MSKGKMTSAPSGNKYFDGIVDFYGSDNETSPRSTNSASTPPIDITLANKPQSEEEVPAFFGERPTRRLPPNTPNISIFDIPSTVQAEARAIAAGMGVTPVSDPQAIAPSTIPNNTPLIRKVGFF